MRFLRDLSIKTKLSLITLLTCTTALALACVALFVHEVRSFQRTAMTDLSAQARILAGLSTSSLNWGDNGAVNQMLAELRGQPQVDAAVIFRKGQVFAKYQRTLAHVTLPSVEPPEDGHEHTNGQLILHRRILHKDQQIGTIYLIGNTLELQARLWEYGWILLCVFLASTFFALLLAARLQELIATPVLRLAATARTIAEHQDYSARAEKFGADELGGLTDAFNQMLTRIQAQDRAIKESRERYEVAVMGSSDGLWDINLIMEKAYYSPRCKAMLGYSDEEIPNERAAYVRLIHPEDLELFNRTCSEYLQGLRPVYEIEFRLRHKSGEYRWILARGAALRDEDGMPIRLAGSHTDITERRKAAEELEALNRQIVEASRIAGMAEVATGVLHNVGNVLNSVNVSATLVRDRFAKSKVASLLKTAQLLKLHEAEMSSFLTADPRGRLVPEFIIRLADHLVTEQAEQIDELMSLTKNIEHIKEVVAMQQSYARVAGVLEPLPPAQLIEDALQLNDTALARHRIRVVKEFAEVPCVLVDKHKVLQILINLIRNAKHALDHGGTRERILTLSVAALGPHRVKITVRDNGVGIDPQNLTRIFQHGFTTKKEGHGFGLHSGANAAKELGGSLTVHSAGLGHGAAFELELPASQKKELPRAA